MDVKQAQKQRNFYLKNQVLTASPNKLISLLISGGIKAIKLAEISLDQNDIVKANHELLRAQDIVDELKFSLDHSVDSQITTDLDRLYNFITQQLVDANVSKDKEKLPPIVKLLDELLETWNEVSQKQNI